MTGSPERTVYIGVDIGGTKIDGVLIDAQGAIYAADTRPTDADQGVDAVIERIVDIINNLNEQASAPLGAIGIGCTGIVDSARGMVRASVHLRWHDVALRDHVSAQLDYPYPIVVENDLKAAITGEAMFGAGSNARSIVYLSIGTGLGAAAYVDGHAQSIEIGHYRLYGDDGRLCTCGQTGCIETALSGTGIGRAGVLLSKDYPDTRAVVKFQDRDLLGNINSLTRITPQQILAAHRDGDALAVRLIDDMRDGLAQTIALCAGMFQPERVIIGGGFGIAAYDAITHGVLDAARAYILPEIIAPISLSLPLVPRQAVGAGALALQHFKGKV